MKYLRNILAMVMVVVFGTQVNAQYTGKGAAGEFYTVQQIKDNASKLDKTDAIVKVKGFIIEQTGHEKYTLQDATGKLKVEIDQKYLPATTFNEKTELILIGEVDHDLLEGTELEVKQVVFVK